MSTNRHWCAAALSLGRNPIVLCNELDCRDCWNAMVQSVELAQSEGTFTGDTPPDVRYDSINQQTFAQDSVADRPQAQVPPPACRCSSCDPQTCAYCGTQDRNCTFCKDRPPVIHPEDGHA